MSTQTISGEGTKNLDRVLGKKDFFAVAIGQIIGAGIFSLLPSAIGLTGRSASFAFLFASFLTILTITPRLFVMGTIRMRGGNYTYISLFSGKKLAGAYLIIHALNNISLSMYSLSVAEYLSSAIDGLNIKLIAVIVLTVVAGLNILGVKNAMRVQSILVVCLLTALSIFCAFGIVRIDPSAYLEPSGLFTGGFMGFCSASALLTFSTGGAQNIINFSAEAKNPTKDMPIVIITSTLLVAVLYAILGVVASGILPVEVVANKPLSLVAAEILPGPLYVFFMVGGAMFALLTTLNSQMAWCTKPLLQGCDDGWLPKKLGAVNKKYKTPHNLILLFYFIGIIPLIFEFDMNTISGTAVFSSAIIDIVLAGVLFRLPTVIPKEWKKSSWHVSNKILYIITVVGVLSSTFTAYMSLRSLNGLEMLANISVMILALAFGYIVDKKGNVNMEISYEES